MKLNLKLSKTETETLFEEMKRGYQEGTADLCYRPDDVQKIDDESAEVEAFIWTHVFPNTWSPGINKVIVISDHTGQGSYFDATVEKKLRLKDPQGEILSIYESAEKELPDFSIFSEEVQKGIEHEQDLLRGKNMLRYSWDLWDLEEILLMYGYKEDIEKYFTHLRNGPGYTFKDAQPFALDILSEAVSDLSDETDETYVYELITF